MPISIACPHCDWTGKVKDELAGKTGKCPTCGERIQIPPKGSPPPVRAGKKPVDDEPDVVDDADVVEDEPRSRSKSGGRSGVGSKARRDDDENRPRRRRDEDDEDDRPSRSRRRDDDEDDRPSKARRRRDEDDEEEDRPRRRRVADDDEDDRPRRKRKGGKMRRRESSDEGMSGKKIGQIVGAIIFLLIGIGLLAFYFMFGGRRFPFWAIIIIVISLISLGQAFMSSGDDDEE